MYHVRKLSKLLYTTLGQIGIPKYYQPTELLLFQREQQKEREEDNNSQILIIKR